MPRQSYHDGRWLCHGERLFYFSPRILWASLGFGGCGGKDSFFFFFFKICLWSLSVSVCICTHEFRILPKLQTSEPPDGVTGSCGLLWIPPGKNRTTTTISSQTEASFKYWPGWWNLARSILWFPENGQPIRLSTSCLHPSWDKQTSWCISCPHTSYLPAIKHIWCNWIKQTCLGE